MSEASITGTARPRRTVQIVVKNIYARDNVDDRISIRVKAGSAKRHRARITSGQVQAD